MSMFTKMVRKYVPQARGKSLSVTSGINKLTYNATDLFGTVIDPFKNPLTKDIFGREGVLDVYGAMNFSTNIFSNVNQLTNKFQTGFTEELSKFSSGMGIDQWGGRFKIV